MADVYGGESVSGYSIILTTLLVKVLINANTLRGRPICIQNYLEVLETNPMRQTGEMQYSIRLARLSADSTFRSMSSG